MRYVAAVLSALALWAPAPPRAEATAERIPLPAGFAYPNGIARGSDGTLYVGSVTSGRVLRLPPGAPGWDTLFPGSPSIFAGTSLRLDEPRGLLWGASPDFLGAPRADGPVERHPHRTESTRSTRARASRAGSCRCRRGASATTSRSTPPTAACLSPTAPARG